MLRIVLLLSGLMLLFIQHSIFPVSPATQFIIFLTGILLVGVPHGAADLLVANQNADSIHQKFSKITFLINYLGRLIAFAIIFYFFPVAGNIIFIFFAAYHFGETDLFYFKTNTLLGKLFVIAYGLVILSVILLRHFEEVIPLFRLFESGKANLLLIDWIGMNRYSLMSLTGIFFFTITFIYFLKYAETEKAEKGQFLIQFALILFILYNLPLLLGFTFYFVVWHSVLSLKNIINYLRQEKRFSTATISGQILLYSALAIGGIFIFGFSGFMFVNPTTLSAYIFIGLAVLTAPHMEVMHSMYRHLRSHSSLSI